MEQPSFFKPSARVIVKNPVKHYTSASLWAVRTLRKRFFALVLISVSFHTTPAFGWQTLCVFSLTIFPTLSMIPDAVAALRIKEKECLSLGRAFFNVQY